MTKEQIEKAIDARLDEPDNEWDGIFNSGYSKGFRDGAQWRINSVWHDASEIPQHSGLLIAICKDGKAVLCGPNNSNWEITVKIFHIVRWVYLDDLTPEIKEDTK